MSVLSCKVSKPKHVIWVIVLSGIKLRKEPSSLSSKVNFLALTIHFLKLVTCLSQVQYLVSTNSWRTIVGTWISSAKMTAVSLVR